MGRPPMPPNSNHHGHMPPHMRPPMGGGPPPMRPPGYPPMPMNTAPPGTAPTGPTILNKPPTYSKRVESSGPAVTVFVGNITERAPDVMIRQILNTCGPVLSWKRVQGASGKLQG